MSEVLQKGTLQSIQEYKSNFDWFLSNYESIKQKYKGKSIAINNKEIIDLDDNIESLINRIKTKYKEKINAILIQYVPENEYSLTV